MYHYIHRPFYMWNLQIHSETEESAKYVFYFLICPPGRDPPLEVSETQPQNLNGDSFCLECQFMSFFVIGGIWRGKIPFAKSVSISFSNQRINQLLLTAPQRCCCFFVEVMMNWTMSCMVASPQPRSAKLRHCQWTLHDMPRLWVVLNCKIFVYTSVS